MPKGLLKGFAGVSASGGLVVRSRIASQDWEEDGFAMGRLFGCMRLGDIRLLYM